MDFLQIKFFLAIVKWGSMSEAARNLYCSQSGLSSKIQRLEEELGMSLFDRSTRPLEMTPAGEIFHRYAVSAHGIEERLFRDLYQEKNRDIHIGASNVPANYLLPPILTRYQQEFPDRRFYIKRSDSGKVIREVEQGIIDFGVVGTKTDTENVTFTPVCDDRLVLALPNNDKYRELAKKPVEELLEMPLIVREEGSGTLIESRRVIETVINEDEASEALAFMNDTEMIVRFIREGMGASVLSCWVAREHVKNGDMISVELPGSAKRPFYLVSKSEAMMNSNAVPLMHYLHGELKKLKL